MDKTLIVSSASGGKNEGSVHTHRASCNSKIILAASDRGKKIAMYSAALDVRPASLAR